MEETEKGYAEAIDARPAKGEVEETEAGYAKAKEEREEKEGDEGSCPEGGGGTCPCNQEKARWAENGWVSWKQNPESGKWSEEEVRAEHERDKRDRETNWWGGYRFGQGAGCGGKEGLQISVPERNACGFGKQNGGVGT